VLLIDGVLTKRVHSRKDETGANSATETNARDMRQLKMARHGDMQRFLGRNQD